MITPGYGSKPNPESPTLTDKLFITVPSQVPKVEFTSLAPQWQLEVTVAIPGWTTRKDKDLKDTVTESWNLIELCWILEKENSKKIEQR